jgi:hypothetical protein
METLTMEKITDYTEFDFYYSETAFKKNGGMRVNGKRYVERIVKGKTPRLGKLYKDLELVDSGMSIHMTIERI